MIKTDSIIEWINIEFFKGSNILLFNLNSIVYFFFQASALINDDSSNEADDSSPTDATKGIISPYYVGFEKYVKCKISFIVLYLI